MKKCFNCGKNKNLARAAAGKVNGKLTYICDNCIIKAKSQVSEVRSWLGLDSNRPSKIKMNAVLASAFKFAKQKHSGQFRYKFVGGKKIPSEEPYFSHPTMVYEILLKVTKDKDLLCAAYLHDTLEDTETTYSELKKEFGKKAADIVIEVTKDEKGKYPIKTREGLMLKLADTLHNVSTHGSKEYLAEKKKWLEDQCDLEITEPAELFHDSADDKKTLARIGHARKVFGVKNEKKNK